MAAYTNQVTSIEEIKTGKGIGPVTTKITLAQAIVGLIFGILAMCGIVLPLDMYVYATVITSAVVGYFSKGRAYVKETKTLDGMNTPAPIATPLFEEGDGKHRLDESEKS